MADLARLEVILKYKGWQKKLFDMATGTPKHRGKSPKSLRNEIHSLARLKVTLDFEAFKDKIEDWLRGE